MLPRHVGLRIGAIRSGKAPVITLDSLHLDFDRGFLCLFRYTRIVPALYFLATPHRRPESLFFPPHIVLSHTVGRLQSASA